jgi:4-aminobutyrate aminotransferase/diaminobutyrate-pyruvate transaminase/4-aminobutyrate aminotransferase/(S)-3-amino-2-methylpropionate transaminase
MASQSAGGFPDQKAWMGIIPEGFHQIPFPECARCPWGKNKYNTCGVECLERSLSLLKRNGVADSQVAGVLAETFQGPYVDFMPLDYIRALREWTLANNTLLAQDEIQAGIGRTGKWFGFEHYGTEPDLVCMGKGLTSCLPMSAVAGRARILDIPEHGEMSSTHTGNPLCSAAAIANISAIRDQGMIENAARLGSIVHKELQLLKEKFPCHIGAINGMGLVWAVYLLNPETRQLDPRLSDSVTMRCMELGLLMLQTGRGTLKIAPPLCITEHALVEGLGVIEEAMWECVS